MRTAEALVAVTLALAPVPASAHPHVFIDGGIDLLFDGEGRLEALRVLWIYDPLTTLFLLEDLGLSPEADLTPADETRLAASQTEWQPGFAGDSYLWNGAEPVALSGPETPSARLRDGRAEITFLRRLARPFRPGPDETTVLKAYDPEYYTAYALTRPSLIEGGSGGCHATTLPFQPDASLATLMDSLATIPADGTPDGEPGALLADEIRVSCD